jgi:hypothetical protein
MRSPPRRIRLVEDCLKEINIVSQRAVCGEAKSLRPNFNER